MRHSGGLRAVAIAAGVIASWGGALAACSSVSPAGGSVYTDAGLRLPGQGSGGGDSGLGLKALAPPADPGPGAIYVTASGEVGALTGYPFPPSDWANATYMADGWQIQIEEFIVVLDHVTLWSNPDTDPTKQALHGPRVAHVDGPFVVDLHKAGPIAGQGGGQERATPIAVLTSQNDNGGARLDSSASYAFGFSTVAASYSAPGGEPGPFDVNLGPEEQADFDLMVQKGYSVLYVGTARWTGAQSPYGCQVTSAGAGTGDAGYDYSRMPTSMTFRLGFSTPTNYVNCQNETLQGMPVGNEDYPRGIQVSPSQSVFAQVTVHMDHPFWESLAEDSPVHWDPIAAQYAGAAGAPEATVEDLIGVPFYAFTDRLGTPLPWRNCAGTYYTPPAGGQMLYETLSVPVNPKGTCAPGDCPALRDFYDYMRYSQSTQGHLNSQGLCYIDRQYPAPPGGS